MLRVIKWLCLFPLFYVIAFYVYAAIGNDAGCGSQDPGFCFGAGVLLMIMMPLAFIFTILAVLLFAKDAWHGRSRKND